MSGGKVVAIVQARMGSTRLPGKVLKEVCGKPMLWHLINRLRHARLVDQIVIATTYRVEDLAVVQFAKENGVDCFEGNVEDVLDRYYQAAKNFNAGVVVRVTGDCPTIFSTAEIGSFLETRPQMAKKF